MALIESTLARGRPNVGVEPASKADIPAARYSSTSWTVMRVPRTQGLPLRTPGVTVISRSPERIAKPTIVRGSIGNASISAATCGRVNAHFGRTHFSVGMEAHVLDAGHKLLETHSPAAVALILDFIKGEAGA